MNSGTKVQHPGDREAIDVGASFSTNGYPDTDDSLRGGGIQVTAMIPRPAELEPDVFIAVDGRTCFKVQATLCRTVWKQTRSGQWRLAQECYLGNVTICLDQVDWS